MILTIIIGMFILLVDVKTFKKENCKKDAKFATFLGWTYIVGGVIMYVVGKFIT